MEFTDSVVLFHQCGESGTEHLFRTIFVEFRERLRLWEIQTGFLVGGAYEFCSVSLAGAGADADTVECDFALCPVFAEEARLRFTERGQFVVVRLKEGCLRVAYEIENTHGQVGC